MGCNATADRSGSRAAAAEAVAPSWEPRSGRKSGSHIKVGGVWKWELVSKDGSNLGVTWEDRAYGEKRSVLGGYGVSDCGLLGEQTGHVFWVPQRSGRRG